jgi:long-chain acyl-CoA synthetase
MGTLVSLLDRAVEKFPGRVAVKSKLGGENWTYEQFKDEALKVSGALSKHGVGKGDRVAIISDNTPAFAAGDYGVLYSGATSVPIDQNLRPADLLPEYLNLAEPKVILVEGKYFHKVNSKTNIPVIPLESALDAQPYRPDVKINVEDPSTIIFSSGTSAESERSFKAVVLSHQNIFSNVIATEHLPTRAEKVDGYPQGVYLGGIGRQWHSFEYMMQKAFFHAGGLLNFTSMGKLREGAAAEINPHYMIMIPDLANMMMRRIKKQVKSKTGRFYPAFEWCLKHSGDFYYELKNNGSFDVGKRCVDLLGDQVFYKRIRKDLEQKIGKNKPYFIGGSAKLPVDLQIFFYILDLPIFQGYGLTETSPVICVNTPENYRFESSGKIIRGTNVIIADETALEDRKIHPLGRGETGVILVEGPNVFKKYLRDPERTRNAFVDGWFNTEDLGYSKKGFLHIQGRIKDILRSLKGESVDAASIEPAYRNEGRISRIVLVGNDQQKIGALIVPDDASRAALKSGRLDEIGFKASLCENELSNSKEKFGFRFLRGNTAIITDFDENPGLVTNTMKVRRALVQRHYTEKVNRICNPK